MTFPYGTTVINSNLRKKDRDALLAHPGCEVSC